MIPAGTGFPGYYRQRVKKNVAEDELRARAQAQEAERALGQEVVS